MRRVGVLRNAQVLPFLDVLVSNARIVGGILAVAGHVGNDRHGLDTDHALQSEVGLVSNGTSQSQTRKRGKPCPYARDPAKSSVEIWLAG